MSSVDIDKVLAEAKRLIFDMGHAGTHETVAPCPVCDAIAEKLLAVLRKHIERRVREDERERVITEAAERIRALREDPDAGMMTDRSVLRDRVLCEALMVLVFDMRVPFFEDGK